MDIFLGVVLGIFIGYWLFSFFYKKRGMQHTEKQSIVLMEKIKSVCKLISVEGDFAEIYHYENQKNSFLNLISSKKQAILLIKAKVHIGFDLSQIKLTANTSKNEIVLADFPPPKVLSVETNVEYYDKKEGFFNKFKAEDLTQLQTESKAFIVNKIPESGLINTAEKEALDTILMIEKLLETSGWKFNYTAITLPNNSAPKLTQ